MISSSSDRVSKSVSEAKWAKGKKILRDLLSKLQENPSVDLDFKFLESKTDFLGHLSMTFEFLVPFLKGFYLTINGWRLGKDKDTGGR